MTLTKITFNSIEKAIKTMSRQTNATSTMPVVNPYTAVLIRRVGARLERQSSRYTRTSTITSSINHSDFQNSPVRLRDDIKTIVEDTLEYARYKHKPITVPEAIEIRAELTNLGQVLFEMVQERWQNHNSTATVELTEAAVAPEVTKVAQPRFLSGRRGSLGQEPHVPIPKISGVTGSVGADPIGPKTCYTSPEGYYCEVKFNPDPDRIGHHSCCGWKCSTQDSKPSWPETSKFGQKGFLPVDFEGYHPCCGWRCSSLDSSRNLPLPPVWSDPDQFVKNGAKRDATESVNDPTEDLYSSRNLIMPQPELLLTPPLQTITQIDPDATLVVPAPVGVVSPVSETDLISLTEPTDLGGWTAINMPEDTSDYCETEDTDRFRAEPLAQTLVKPFNTELVVSDPPQRPETPYTPIPATFFGVIAKEVDKVTEPINLTPYSVGPDASKVYPFSNGPFTTIWTGQIPQVALGVVPSKSRTEPKLTKSARSSASSSPLKGRSQYNDFMKEEIARLKAINPAMEHKAAFKQAAANWSGYKVTTDSVNDSVTAHIINSAI